MRKFWCNMSRTARFATAFLVACLLLGVFAPLLKIKPVEATTLFSGGFEEAQFNPSPGVWSGNKTDADCTGEVVTTAPHHGSYQAHFVTNATASWTDSRIHKTVTATTTLHVRQYIVVNSMSGTILRGVMGLAPGATPDYGEVARLGLTTAGALKLRYQNGASVSEDTSATNLTTGVTYCIELYGKVDASAGEFKVYLDGVEVADLTHTGLDSDGVGNIANFYIGLDNANSNAVDMYSDCVVAASSYIGLESTEFGLTINSNPVSVQYEINGTAISGNTINAVSGNASDIQYAVDAMHALGNGTVHIPAGNFTFNVNQSKTAGNNRPCGVKLYGGVNLIGAGNNQTILYCPLTGWDNTDHNAIDFMITAVVTNGKPIRISGIMFQGTVNMTAGETEGKLTALGLYGVKDYRIDHCTFLNIADTAILVSNNYAQSATGNCGVIDHCIIDNPYKDVFWNNTGNFPYWAYGIVVEGGYPAGAWDADYTHFFGQYNNDTCFIEDCSIARCRHAVAGGSQSHGYYVMRNCNMTDMVPAGYGSYQDVHGGAQGCEVYNCTIVNTPYDYRTTSNPANWGLFAGIGLYTRGGFALYYNNTIKYFNSSSSGITLTNDQSNVLYKTHGVWIWGNSYVDVTTQVNIVPNVFSITLETDYWLHAPNASQFTYMPYIYPQPLTSVFGSTNATVTLSTNTYTITVPTQVSSGGYTYNFSHWQDSSINNTIIVSLTVNTTITATYVDVTIVVVTIISPRNTTYSASQISVSFTASGGTIDEMWFNLKNGTDWVYATNQTYPGYELMIGLTFDRVYTFYAYANNTDGNSGQASVMFTVSSYVGGAPSVGTPSASTALEASTCTISCTLTDDVGLVQGILSTNGTSAWVNNTAKSLSGLFYAFSDTVVLPSATTVFGYKIFVSDSAGQWTTSSIYTFITTSQGSTLPQGPPSGGYSRFLCMFTVSSNGRALQDLKIRLWENNYHVLIETLQTDSEGYVETELPSGTYEYSADFGGQTKRGYVLLDDAKKITIDFDSAQENTFDRSSLIKVFFAVVVMVCAIVVALAVKNRH